MNQMTMEQLNKKRMKQFLMFLCFAMLFMTFMYNPLLNVFAAPDTSAVTNKITNLQDLVAAIISSFGTIIALWGIFEFGLAMQGNDGMMQSHSFKRIGGGLLMSIAPQVLLILTN